MTGVHPIFAAVVVLGLLTACGPAQEPASPASAVSQAPEASPPVESMTPPAEAESCLDQIGQQAADQLAQQCREVSPATRPPCNTANPCAMIQDEIDRSCALWAERDDLPEACAD